MSWIKSRWQSVVVLAVVGAAIAVPAWASSGGGEEQQATEPSGSDAGAVEPAPASADDGNAVPVRPLIDRDQLDQALQCMADHGFGMGTPTEEGGAIISREETQTDEFKQAAADCKLPPPPTDAQMEQMAQSVCQDALHRRDAGEDPDSGG